MKELTYTSRKDRAKNHKFRLWSRQLINYSFVLPAALFLIFFIAYPVFFNISMSFQDLKAANLLKGGNWIGFENYQKVLATPVVLQAIRNTLLFTTGSIFFQLLFGLALALFYNLEFPGSQWMRGLYLVAWTIPVIVVGAIFRWLLDGQAGAANWLFVTLGVTQEKVSWLADVNLALPAITAINIWLGIPFNMALLLAGLQGIPKELYEAASIDGANNLSKFRFVTLPMLRPALVAVLLLGLIYTFKVFDVVWSTTQGGPFNATHLISTVAFEQIFRKFLFGQGAALLNLLFAVLFGISLLYLWNIKNEEQH
ncbi:MAG: carbohydrate ABC transporter permease [Trueperaceae bacterium]